MSRKLFYATVLFALFLLFGSSYGDTNILTNPGFESGTTGWIPRWSTSIAAVSFNPHSGAYRCRVYNRSAAWEGIQQDVKEKMVIGETYTISGWMRTSTSASSTIQITFQQTDGAGVSYHHPATGTASNSGWVQISGSFTLNVTGALTELYVFVEGPAAGIDIFVDDMVVYGPQGAPPPDPIKASNPNPNDGASNVSIACNLSWAAPAGFTPTSYDVYFGTNPIAHSNPKNTVFTNSYNPPGNLDEDTAYYWAVDSNNAGTIYAGDDWSFTTYKPTPSWDVGERCFFKRPGFFDGTAVKDPSIVYSGGKWHLFYTGKDPNYWRMGYASAASIADLNNATRYYMGTLNVGLYFCAPEVFWFESKNKWYLIYNSGIGPTYSTNTDINNPAGWSAGQQLFNDSGYDFSCISDGNNVYCFYSAGDGSFTIKRRSTTVANFPTGWSSPSVAATETFEGTAVYKSLADGKYYMIVEDISRYFELWSASSPGGTWTKIFEKWASKDNLIYNADHWTDEVSHGEIMRSGTNEKKEISNINTCDLIIQGVPTGSYPDYGLIPYDIGVIQQRQCPAADLNFDCAVDFTDFAVLASQWQQPPGTPSADIAPNGIVDIDDLILLVDSWLWGK